MDRQLLIVANGFRIVGLALGAPALAAFLCLAYAWLSLRGGPSPPPPATTSIGKDGLIGLLVAGGRGVGGALRLVVGASAWVIGVVAVLCLLLVLLAAAVFLTGRGLREHAEWARWMGGLLTLGLLLGSSGAWMALRRGPAVAAAISVSAAAYVLWVLARRFT